MMKGLNKAHGIAYCFNGMREVDGIFASSKMGVLILVENEPFVAAMSIKGHEL